MNSTINYYNENARIYFEKTVEADMSSIYSYFTRFLKPGAHICDLGCGSGRDSSFFISKGFFVTPIDGSNEMCKLASNYLKREVLCLRFHEMNFSNEFDAIWACSSLLHVPKNEIGSIIENLILASKNDAVIYTCFKNGFSECKSDGRLFSGYSEEELLNLISKYKELDLGELWISDDVRKEENHRQWLNVILHVRK